MTALLLSQCYAEIKMVLGHIEKYSEVEVQMQKPLADSQYRSLRINCFSLSGGIGF